MIIGNSKNESVMRRQKVSHYALIIRQKREPSVHALWLICGLLETGRSITMWHLQNGKGKNAFGKFLMDLRRDWFGQDSDTRRTLITLMYCSLVTLSPKTFAVSVSARLLVQVSQKQIQLSRQRMSSQPLSPVHQTWSHFIWLPMTYWPTFFFFAKHLSYYYQVTAHICSNE